MLIKVYPGASQPQNLLDTVSKVLRDGGIIILPTDSVYSICCDALNAKALESLAQLKGVDVRKSSFAIFCASLSQASNYARIDDDVFRLMKENTPGAFTFILPISSTLPKIYKWRKEVGVRIPDCPMLRTIIDYYGSPITGFSLPEGDSDRDDEYAYHPELIDERWGKIVDLVLDGGELGTIPSTIVDCTTSDYEIKRQGLAYLRI